MNDLEPVHVGQRLDEVLHVQLELFVGDVLDEVAELDCGHVRHCEEDVPVEAVAPVKGDHVALAVGNSEAVHLHQDALGTRSGNLKRKELTLILMSRFLFILRDA